MITFSQVNEKDLNDITEIYNYYVLNSTATFQIEPLSVAEMKELLFFSNPRYKSFVITENQEIIGYCILAQYKKREAFDVTAEAAIYLKHGCLSKGVGSLALQHIETEARKAGFHTLVGLITGENTASLRLFAKNGFIKCGHLKGVGKKFNRSLDLIYYQKIIG